MERLVRLVEELETPVVQVWGPAGSGRSALLAALLEREGAVGLAPADLVGPDAPGSPGDAVARAVADGARWLVCHGLPGGADPETVLRQMADRLPAGRRLVVATGRRIAAPDVLCGLVTPRDLALTPAEASAAWEEVTGRRPEPEEADRLVELTGGRHRVVVLAARGAAKGAAQGEAKRAAQEAGGRGEGREIGREILDDPAVAELLRQWPPDGSPPGEPLPAGALRIERPEPRFRLRLLGQPEAHLRRDDRDPGEPEEWQRISFSLRRGLRVLAFLATSPDHRASREELIEEIWSEEDRETIERNFHPTLSRLRRDLRGGAAASGSDLEPLVHREGFYELDPALGWWIDVEEIERLTERGRGLVAGGRDPEAVGLLEAAWRLYRGALLEGVYDPWAARRREAVQRRHLALLRELGEAYERLDRPDDAVDAYRALLTDDPLQERIHVALMRIYSDRGRRDLVRRQYERLTKLLRNELGVEPLPETADEYHRLMIERG